MRPELSKSTMTFKAFKLYRVSNRYGVNGTYDPGQWTSRWHQGQMHTKEPAEGDLKRTNL